MLLLQQELIGKSSGIDKADLQKAKAINKGAFGIHKLAKEHPRVKHEFITFA